MNSRKQKACWRAEKYNGETWTAIGQPEPASIYVIQSIVAHITKLANNPYIEAEKNC